MRDELITILRMLTSQPPAVKGDLPAPAPAPDPAPAAPTAG
ncbi:MAG: acetyl-CoA carboxylase carboxyl transferase subunit beta, partial [Pseudorhodobacter sp.]|nr:acetyl-CoA carboxylase carboxyl transferase subunit beta [Pseudorhodobacter sp.]